MRSKEEIKKLRKRNANRDKTELERSVWLLIWCVAAVMVWKIYEAWLDEFANAMIDHNGLWDYSLADKVSKMFKQNY